MSDKTKAMNKQGKYPKGGVNWVFQKLFPHNNICTKINKGKR